MDLKILKTDSNRTQKFEKRLRHLLLETDLFLLLLGGAQAERENQEQVNQEQEKQEQEKQEQEKLEREKQEQEKQEQEKLEREKQRQEKGKGKAVGPEVEQEHEHEHEHEQAMRLVEADWTSWTPQQAADYLIHRRGLRPEVQEIFTTHHLAGLALPALSEDRLQALGFRVGEAVIVGTVMRSEIFVFGLFSFITAGSYQYHHSSLTEIPKPGGCHPRTPEK